MLSIMLKLKINNDDHSIRVYQSKLDIVSVLLKYIDLFSQTPILLALCLML